MVKLRRSRPDRGPISTVGLLVRFTAAGLIVLLSLAALIAIVARQAGVEQARESARQVTYVTARGVVEPRLNAAVVAGQPAALQAFDTAMRRYVLQGSLVRVKLWSADGRIVYSDEPQLIGKQFPLGPEEEEALRLQGSSASEVSDLSRPENRFEIPYKKLLEVYVGVRGPNGEAMLFEAYFQYQAVSDAGRAAWQRFAPPALGALLVLELVQIPFAWSLARRVQRQQRERERLLQHAVDASDAERRRIAGELHDGVVQELTGLNYALDAMRLGNPSDGQRAELIADSAGRLRAQYRVAAVAAGRHLSAEPCRGRTHVGVGRVGGEPRTGRDRRTARDRWRGGSAACRRGAVVPGRAGGRAERGRAQRSAGGADQGAAGGRAWIADCRR